LDIQLEKFDCKRIRSEKQRM